MAQSTNRIILATFLLLTILGMNVTSAGNNPGKLQFEIKTAGIGTDDTFLYSIVCHIKTPQSAADIASECAVYGVIFKGCEAAGRFPAQTPLFTSDTLSESQAAYFDTFFTDKLYNSYIAMPPKIISVTKTKKEYTAEVVVAVNKQKLRSELESAGIIEELGNVFGK